MENFKDKFNLTRNQNLFLAKKEIVSSIYNATKLEGCNTSFIQTEKILKGINDINVSVDDIRIILNLQSAWQFILKNLDKELTLELICKVNENVSRGESLDWGVLRYGEGGVHLYDGSRFTPEPVIKEEVLKRLEEIKKIESVTERAIRYYLWATRSQLFWDGNKRTSSLVANFILIKEGKGIFNIQEKNLDEFAKRLSDFYVTNDETKIDRFLYENCITGLYIDKKLEEEYTKDFKKNSWTEKISNEKSNELEKD